MSEKLTPERELDEIFQEHWDEIKPKTPMGQSYFVPTKPLKAALLTWRNKRDKRMEERVTHVMRSFGIKGDAAVNLVQAIRGPEICEKCHQEIRP